MNFPLSAITPFLGALFANIAMLILLIASVRYLTQYRREAIGEIWPSIGQIGVAVIGLRAGVQIMIYYAGIMLGLLEPSAGTYWLRDMIGYILIVLAIQSLIGISRISIAQRYDELEVRYYKLKTQVIECRVRLGEPISADDFYE